jgi:hypothetical protein
MSIQECDNAESVEIKSKPRRIDQRILTFVKEWGGILTIVIAIIYTLPLQVIDRLDANREKPIAAARQALASTFTLRAEKISALQKADEQLPEYQSYVSAVNAAFDLQIYNVITTNKELFNRVKDNLRPSELYSIGSAFSSFIGDLKTSQIYYDLAIKKALTEGNHEIVASTYREKSSTLFISDPDQSRKYYTLAMQIMTNSKNHFEYAILLSELISWELTFGDWECGQKLKDIVLKMYEKIEKSNQAIRPYKISYVRNWKTISKKEEQPDKGCTYELPQL